jgi:hypothetical protein
MQNVSGVPNGNCPCETTDRCAIPVRARASEQPPEGAQYLERVFFVYADSKSFRRT